LSPIERTSREVLSAVLALGGKKAAAKRLKIPLQTLTKLMKESFPDGPEGTAARSARVKFDKAFLSKKLTDKEKRDISQFATAMRKLMPPKDINKMVEDPDKYAGAERIAKLMKAYRVNVRRGYGVRLTTQSPKDKAYYRPRIVLQVHRPKPKKGKTNAAKKSTKKNRQSKSKVKALKSRVKPAVKRRGPKAAKRLAPKVSRPKPKVKKAGSKKKKVNAKQTRKTAAKRKTVSRVRRRSSKR
jgi:hypothetical protein